MTNSLKYNVILIQRYWRKKVYQICPVCFENKLLINNYKCNHKICKKCIKNWNLINPSCPLCRSNTITKINDKEQHIINIPTNQNNHNINITTQNNQQNIIIQHDDTEYYGEYCCDICRRNYHLGLLCNPFGPLCGLLYSIIILSIMITIFELLVK